MMRRSILLFFFSFFAVHAQAQINATDLFYTIRQKVMQTHDYVADVRMKIEVSFMNIPLLKGRLYYKSPDKMRLERNGGISIMPKKNINLSMGNFSMNGNVTVIDAGTENSGGTRLRIIKIIPEDDNNDIVLTKAWIDESKMLIMRTESTTRENGTVRMELEYGRYMAQSLPDKVTFIIDVKDYKMPKGMTMDYDDGTHPDLPLAGKKKKGRIEIRYLSYVINQGLSDSIFTEAKK